MTQLEMITGVSKESIMVEQNLGQVSDAGERLAEDNALQLFQIAALMLGDEQEAVSLVEEAVASVDSDPCAEGTLAYTEARALLVRTALQRMARQHPDGFSTPAAEPASASCIETDDLGAADLSGEQLSALLTGAGRAGMREWLVRLPGRMGKRPRKAFVKAGPLAPMGGAAIWWAAPIARRFALWLHA